MLSMASLLLIAAGVSLASAQDCPSLTTTNPPASLGQAPLNALLPASVQIQNFLVNPIAQCILQCDLAQAPYAAIADGGIYCVCSSSYDPSTNVSPDANGNFPAGTFAVYHTDFFNLVTNIPSPDTFGPGSGAGPTTGSGNGNGGGAGSGGGTGSGGGAGTGGGAGSGGGTSSGGSATPSGAPAYGGGPGPASPPSSASPTASPGTGGNPGTGGGSAPSSTASPISPSIVPPMNGGNPSAGNPPASSPGGVPTMTPSSTSTTPSSSNIDTAPTPSPTDNGGGFGSAFSLFQPAGCYSEPLPHDGSVRALDGYAVTGLGNLTIDSCVNICSGLGFSLAGVEAGDECYCGNSLNGAANAGSDCTTPCAGDGTELCGGNFLFSLYESPSAEASVMLPTGTVPGSVSNTLSLGLSSLPLPTGTPTNSPAPTSTPLANGFTARGCYSEPLPHDQTVRALTGLEHNILNLTVNACINLCSTSGFSLAGVEAGDQCFCGNVLEGSTTAPSFDCSTTCSGDVTEVCGGDYLFNLYAAPGVGVTLPSGTADLVITASNTLSLSAPIPSSIASLTSSLIPPAAPTLPTITDLDYTSLGCYAEPTPHSDDLTGRAITNYTTGGVGDLTTQNCIDTCAALGYVFAGTENGDQCFCGDGIYNGATPAPGANCTTPCSGDNTESCGGSYLLNLYASTPYLQTLRLKAPSNLPPAKRSDEVFTARRSRSWGFRRYNF